MQVESTHLQSSSNLTAGDGEVISPADSKCPNLCPNDADEFPLFSENSDALSCKGEKQRRGTNRTLFPSFLASTFIVVYIRGLMRVTGTWIHFSQSPDTCCKTTHIWNEFGGSYNCWTENTQFVREYLQGRSTSLWDQTLMSHSSIKE